MEFLLRGLIIGFSIAAPVGPIGLLCIQRTLTQGWLSGFVTGLGAATADAIYGSIAGFGLDVIAHFLLDERTWIHVVGGILLLLLGIRAFFAHPAKQAALVTNRGPNLGWSYVSTLLLTITNPMTILSFLAVFAALGVANSPHEAASALFTITGVFLGSMIWWWCLSSLTSWLKHKLNSTTLLWLGRLSATIIVGFGLYGIVTAGIF